MDRAVPPGLAADTRFEMAQRGLEMLFADGVHRDMQRTVRILPVLRVQQAARRRHPRRHIVVQRADILARQLSRQLVARLDAHAVEAVGVRKLLFGLRERVALYDLMQTQLDDHDRAVVSECERAHLACGNDAAPLRHICSC